MSRWNAYYFNRCHLDAAVARGYIYMAETDSRGVRPSKKILGDYVAYVIKSGTRRWAFKELINRDKFIDMHPEAKRVFCQKEQDVMTHKQLKAKILSV